MSHPGATDLHFETAADAEVTGDLPTLHTILRESPELIFARSRRNHRATLLHYLGANGVEDSRQRSPQNAVAIAQFLLSAGAEVDAIADIYGRCTPLALVATSIHPQEAGVQLALMEILLDHGADPENGGPLVNACLANNRWAAAEFLAVKGVTLNLAAAAGLGHIDLVQKFFDLNPDLLSTPARDDQPSPAAQGFLWACAYGHDAVVQLFFDCGMPIDTPDRFGQTGLHLAAMDCHLATVCLLLTRGAPLEVRNSYGGTVLGQALWSVAHSRTSDAYLPVITLLLEAGATIPHPLPSVSAEIDALLARWGSPPNPTLSW